MNNLTEEEKEIIFELARYKHSFNLVKTEITGDEITLPYHRNTYNIRLASHLGQRKLIMAMIEFLSDYGHLSYDVVYTGCTAGNYIFYLSELFPEHNFYVYNPNNFLEENSTEHVKLRNSIFTIKDAKEWVGKKILFISDVRNYSNIKGGFINKSREDNITNETNEALENDLIQEATFISIMDPEASMLKFHPPYGSGKFRYLKGIVYSQCWAAKTSSEARLVVLKNCKNNYQGEQDNYEDDIQGLPLELKDKLINKGYEITIYDNKKWENIFYYINTISREWLRYYNPYYNEKVGMCNCYDCCLEAKIWNKYFKTENEGDKNYIISMVEKTNVSISSKLSLCNSPHGAYPNELMICKDKNGNWKNIRNKIVKKYGDVIIKEICDKIEHFKNNKLPKYFS